MSPFSSTTTETARGAAGAVPRRSGSASRLLARLVSALPWRPVLGMLAFLVLLETLPHSGLVNPRYLPPLDRMLTALANQAGSSGFWDALGATLRGSAIGLAIAMAAGVVVGVALGSSRVLCELTTSTVEFFRPIPAVALIPVMVLVIGPNATSTVVLVAYASFWQVLIQVIYGVQDTDPVAYETAASFRFSRLRTLRSVVWPSALPYVWTGLRLASTMALIVEITGELVIRSPGIGRQIALAQSADQVDNLYALVIVAGLIGVIGNVVVRRLEAKTLHWHPSVTGVER